MVPLERSTVRFIDNFSTGTRGARLAEFVCSKRSFAPSKYTFLLFPREFVRLGGHAVVFLHRRHSAFPGAGAATGVSILDLVENMDRLEDRSALFGMADRHKAVRYAQPFYLSRHSHIQTCKHMFAMDFESVFDYLLLLRAVARTLGSIPVVRPSPPPLRSFIPSSSLNFRPTPCLCSQPPFQTSSSPSL
jgi:phosphopantothenate-cysteine ligase